MNDTTTTTAGRRPVTALAATMAGTATTRERDKAREYVQWLEAQLATVPVAEIRTAVRSAVNVYDMPGDRSDVLAIRRWLARQRGEVQP